MTASLLLVCASLLLSAAASAQHPQSQKAPEKAAAAPKNPASKPGKGVRASRFAVEVRQLARLARAAKKEDKPGAAYLSLSAFADRHAKEELGARAALALGYFAYNQGRYAQARRWLDRAKGETFLGDYVLYWSAEVAQALNDNSRALAELQTLLRDYPQSVLTNLALQALGETAIATEQPQVLLRTFATADGVTSNSKLLFLRAEAHEQAGDKIAAAEDYLAVYDHFPLTPEADECAAKIKYLQGALGAAFPVPPLAERLARAGTLFKAHRWQDAGDAYGGLFAELKGPDLEQAQLRSAECKVQTGGSPSLLVSLALPTPAIDAERYFYLSQAYRSANDEADMLAAANQLSSRYPASPWTEQALFAVGNYYWVNLQRDKAASFYQQVVDHFPSSNDVPDARWRIAWTSYMDRNASAENSLRAYLQDYPDSNYTPDALYWLGRMAQRARRADVARAYFRKLRALYPYTYFASHAGIQLRRLGRGRSARLPLLDTIPQAPPLPQLGTREPTEALPWVERSFALQTIAFDDSAILELRAGYTATHAPMLQLAIARAGILGERYGAAIVAIRSVYPHLDARPLHGPLQEIWRLSYPLPYASDIRRDARRTQLNPMLVAALMRQESAFQKTALSTANAFGLMQLLPKTARPLARRLDLRYSEDRLFHPLFNIRLGTVYLSELLKSFHSVEAALAAYNAGEDRVTAWQSGQKYEEEPEFVESIPFTQTRQYVQIVMRNATIYEALYGGRR